jgi:hypothetical protein
MMKNGVVNPRLTDAFGSSLTQETVDFAIPRLQEDIPLYIDPFLLWVSEDPEYRKLHERLIGFFRVVADKVRGGDLDGAARHLAGCEEQRALGLGYASGSKRGSNIGPKLIAEILRVHRDVPQLLNGKIRHMEELQLVVSGIAEDRVSDTSASVLKDFFIHYSTQQAATHGIPTQPARLGCIYDDNRELWVPAPEVALPYNPANNSPMLLAPLNLLRRLPWINYPDYYRSGYAARVLPPERSRAQIAKQAVLEFNARNYVEVERYIDDKERTGVKCRPDPLFQPLAAATLRTKFRELRDLPTGRSDGADRRFEDLSTDLLTSLLYPTLEFAQSRVRTASGAHIRDLIFYNDGKTVFWRDLRERYDARQPVFELKNVMVLDAEHVNQLYRYLDAEFGRFGILVTRNPAPPAVQRNIVDLHSSKGVAVLCMNDRDLELMLSVMDSGRDPSDVLKKVFLEFSRLLPK